MTSAEPGFISQGQLVWFFFFTKNTPAPISQVALGQGLTSALTAENPEPPKEQIPGSWEQTPLGFWGLYFPVKAFLGQIPAALRFAVWL